MLRIKKVYQAPPNSGKTTLDRTLPSLLDEACHSSFYCKTPLAENALTQETLNEQAFHQWTKTGWRSLSNQAFQSAAEAVALGLLSLGLERGDRVALLLHSDVNFCIVDMGCLLAGLVDVPIDLTQTLEQIIWILRHSDAKALCVSNVDLLTQIAPYLAQQSNLSYIMVVDVPTDRQPSQPGWMTFQEVAQERSTSTEDRPETQSQIQLFSLEEIRSKGESQRSVTQLAELRASLAPSQLATLIYIPSPDGQLEGVMLTHENLSANALATFSGNPGLKRGSQEVVLSFLPLNHVLARCMLYGHIHYGHTIYFSNPQRILKHLQEVKPTILVTIPLLLENLYGKILEKGQASLNLSAARPLVSGLLFPWSLFQLPRTVTTRFIFNWALKLAKQYELGREPKGLYALRLKLADWLVLSKWRAVLGGRLRYLICGGAALNAELVNVFAASGVTIFHGYGLTQAGAVVTCNREEFNQSGTVGIPIAGVEVAIAEDDEILVRGPSVMPGYYKNPKATRAAVDEGWLHTGDLGEFTADGFLKVTGIKKALFKLSTGKYIVPRPIETRLKQSPFVDQATVVGSGHKFCAVLIVPDRVALHTYALAIGLDLPNEALLEHPCTLALYQSLVTAVSCHLPYWAAVKRFRLIDARFTVENGLLNANQEINRARVAQVFADDIDALYRESYLHREGYSGRGNKEGRGSSKEKEANAELQNSLSPASIAVVCPEFPESSCPTFAQSLNSRFTH